LGLVKKDKQLTKACLLQAGEVAFFFLLNLKTNWRTLF
jgi:hypothetical protein